ncbi:MAG TPA: ABC transporter ATP-binding protein [Gammaproteobacteria bacterium]|nr:ABC transporter ATP-binding protein [Gammaproteobacteria bacterium]
MNIPITYRHVYAYIASHIKAFPFAILTMLGVALIWAISISVKPYLIKIILNRLSISAQADVFVYLATPILLYLGMNLLLTISYRFYGYFVEIKMIPKLRKQMANDALGKLIEKSHTFYQNNFSGSLTNKVNDLTRSVPEILQIIFDKFISHVLALSIAILTLWQVNYIFALIMLVWNVLFSLGAMLYSKKLTLLADRWSEYGSTITGRIVDVLSNILTVRLFSAKKPEKKLLNETFQQAVNAEQQLQWAYFWMWMCYSLSALLLQVLNFYFLCKGRQEGWITIGDFALVLVLNISIIDYFWQITHEFSHFSKLYGNITQALRAILEKPEIEDNVNANNFGVIQGKITFDTVKFHYKGAIPLFQNMSIEIAAGQKVGLVGYSGSGKTTFVNLILRLYEITNGQILIDNHDIKSLSQDFLRSQIGMIPQDPSLFHRTLLENIRYGRLDAKDEEVIEAAKRAHAHEFIIKLSQGYHSLVGERGIKLSGGQRQRIAIARAVLKNAPILILDEATSQLDSLTEALIQESLWELMQGKTTIVIAHRLSTLLPMDRILVFEKGKIVEDGTHSQLLNNHNLYKSLWDSQIGGFLPDKTSEDL